MMSSISFVQDVDEHVFNPVWFSYFVLLPFISAVGAYFLLREVLLLVYLLVGLTVFAARLKLRAAFADSFFLVLIGAVALSLFLSGTLVSPYVTGDDAHQEFALFQQVVQQGAWRPQVSILYNSALSVAILPSIIGNVSSLDGILIFKIVYPLVFSMVPMILYQIYRKVMNPQAAFLSVFVFLSFQPTYIAVPQLGRQVIAELIMVLLLWIQLSPTLRRTRASSFLVVSLTVGLVMSHYSLALIYIFLIGFSYIASRVSRLRIESLANSSTLAISLVVSVGWFFFVAGGIVLQRFLQLFGTVTVGLIEFSNPATRPTVVIEALGLTSIRVGILHLMNRATQYLVVFCIVLGFLIYMRKSKSSRVEIVLIPLMVASMGFLLASVALPYLAGGLMLFRVYHIALMLLSPCFYFGAAKINEGLQWLCALVTRHPMRMRIGRSVPAAILFSYLLFTSGWVWAVTSDLPTSVVLDQERIVNSSDLAVRFLYYAYYTLSEDVAAAHWIRSRGAAEHLVCSDYVSRFHVLNSYGGYEREGTSLPWGCKFASAYVYLSVSDSILGSGTQFGSNALWFFRFSDTMPMLLAENRVYSDGAVIYETF